MNTHNDSPASAQTFAISRIFRAPRNLVWKAWTDVEHLQKWFGPSGCTIPTCKMDFKPGGIFHYCMRTSDGLEMWGKWTFLEIVKPERLVLIQSFSDKDGGITRHPLSADWPRETLSTTTFAESNGETTITLRWAAHNATEIERKTFDSSHASMQQGWGGTFAQLDRYLEQTLKAAGK
jgi:uncharacterized protein YndB with AHSA1/START domain